MPTIKIEVKNKIAVSPNAEIVCGNGDYAIDFAFDSEWDKVQKKTARFVYNGTYTEIIFEGNLCPVPMISNATVCAIGVFAEGLHTTTPALVACRKSIRCGEAVPATHAPDAYTQVLEMYDQLSKDVEELRKSVENGGGEVNPEVIENAKVMYVTITANEDDNLVADKTYAEIAEAYEAGRTVVAIGPDDHIHHALAAMDTEVVIFTHSTVQSMGYVAISCDDVVEMGYEALADVIPTKVSQLENDSGFVSGDNIEVAVEKYLQENPPAGGGDKWELITDLTATDYSAFFTINQDSNGNPFSLKSMLIFMILPKHTDTDGVEKNTGYAHYKVNDRAPSYQNPASNWANAAFVWTINAYGDVCTIETKKQNGGTNNTPYSAEIFHSSYLKWDGNFTAINSFTWRLFNGYVCPSSQFIVYGVRA